MISLRSRLAAMAIACGALVGCVGSEAASSTDPTSSTPGPIAGSSAGPAAPAPSSGEYTLYRVSIRSVDATGAEIEATVVNNSSARRRTEGRPVDDRRAYVRAEHDFVVSTSLETVRWAFGTRTNRSRQES